MVHRDVMLSIFADDGAEVGHRHAFVDDCHKLFRRVGDKQMLTILNIKTFRANRGGNHHASQRHCLHNFDADAAARKQGYHHNVVVHHEFVGVWHRPDDNHIRVFAPFEVLGDVVTSQSKGHDQL